MKVSKTEAAFRVLKASKKPLHVVEIIDLAVKKGLIEFSGKTPEATLAADLLQENRRRTTRGVKTRFKKVAPNTWQLV